MDFIAIGSFPQASADITSTYFFLAEGQHNTYTIGESESPPLSSKNLKTPNNPFDPFCWAENDISTCWLWGSKMLSLRFFHSTKCAGCYLSLLYSSISFFKKEYKLSLGSEMHMFYLKTFICSKFKINFMGYSVFFLNNISFKLYIINYSYSKQWLTLENV